MTLRPVKIQKEIALLNLSEKIIIEDPIGIKDLHQRVAAISLLDALGHQLSRPVLAADSELDYLPSQYLTEVILDAGYGGILYRSSQAPSGKNVVIFKKDGFQICDPAELCLVEGISYSSKAFSQH